MPVPRPLSAPLPDSPRPASSPAAEPGGKAARRPLFVAGGVLLLAYAWPLYDLLRFSLASELYSHLFLVPPTSAFLVWWKRHALPAASAPDFRWAILPAVLGVALLATRFLAEFDPIDVLATSTLSFVAFFVTICAATLGPATLRAIAFPLAFLVMMAPFPTFVTNGIEAWLQHRSADASHALFQLIGTPIFRYETYFELPGIKLYVAPECSGIHSTLALFIVSLVAGQMFLASPWRRGLLALCVIPLAIVRNAFRIVVIGELCVRLGPHMFDSYIHRQGGPIFFALSLIPFLALLWWLVRGESRRTAATR